MAGTDTILVDALKAGSLRPLDGGMTVAEIRELTRRGEKNIRVRLRGLIAEGRVEVGWRGVGDIAGRVQRIPVYRVKEGGE